MTATHLLRAALRRWYVVLLGLALTGVAVASLKPQTVYWVSQILTVEAPANSADPGPRPLGQPASDPIPTAEMLAGLVNEHSDIERSRNGGATLYGEGFSVASSARLVSVGGQWVTQVQSPNLHLESVNPDEAAALAAQEGELASISRTLEQLQDEFSVATTDRMTLSVSPLQAQAVRITGSKMRATVAASLLGLVVTFWAVYLLERRQLRRRARATPA